MSTVVTVRPVRPEEHDSLARVTVAAYRELLAEHLSEGYAAELADVAARAQASELLVAVDTEGEVLGGIAYVRTGSPLAWFDGSDIAGLRMLAVAPEAQGRGVGAALIDASVARARDEGTRLVLLHTTARMTVAHRVYERAGFRRDPERDVVLTGGLHLLAYALDLGRRQ